MKQLLLLCLVSNILTAARLPSPNPTSYDPTELLLKVSKKIGETVDRLPNYVCRESVQRWTVLPLGDAPPASCQALSNLHETPASKATQKESDHLSFDVAVSKEGEMYSRVGENRFTADNPADLFGTSRRTFSNTRRASTGISALIFSMSGLTSTGAFGIFLRDIFASDAASFTYLGDTTFQGRTLAKFGYSVSLEKVGEKGGYSIENNSFVAVVPYDGTLLVDPQTLDLIRLTVHASHLPKQLKICQTTTTLDYANVRMNDSEFLLLANARVHVDYDDGRESENSIVFAGCHKFGSESTVSFGAPEASQWADTKQSAEREPSLPAPPQQQLAAIRRNVMATVNRLPKYLCTETIDRSTFQPRTQVADRSCRDLASRRKEPKWKVLESESDRLRLDVAVSRDEGEMYSWVGDNKFHDRSLADLVGSGLTSTGAFGTLLGAIFSGDSASFTAEGYENDNGRTLIKFGFRVPLDKSTFNVGNKKDKAIVPYAGTFLADANSFDLVRLYVVADQLPERLHSCDDQTLLEYASVRLNSAEFLLPRSALLHVDYDNGTESENRTVFSGCHEFLGEATVSFDAPQFSETTGIERSKPQPLRLPSGLRFTVSLTRAINTDTAAAGDAVTARLTTSLSEKHDQVLVPKGAPVTGRIARIMRLYGTDSLMLAIRLETIESGGMPQPFQARLTTVVKRSNVNSVPSSFNVEQNLGSFSQMPSQDDFAVGILRFEDFTKGFVIHRGMQLEGITTAPKP